MIKEIDYSNSAIGYLATSYVDKTRSLVSDLQFFQFLFAWYIELDPQGALCSHVKNALNKIKTTRSVKVLWNFPSSLFRFTSSIHEALDHPTLKQRLRIIGTGSYLITSTIYFLEWLKKIGAINLAVYGRDLSGALSDTADYLTLGCKVTNLGGSLKNLYLNPTKAEAVLQCAHSVNKLAISILDIVPIGPKRLLLSLRTASFLYDLSLKNVFSKSDPLDTLYIPYLSQKSVCAEC